MAGGQLDRQRKPVQKQADASDIDAVVTVELEVGVTVGCPLREQLHCRGLGYLLHGRGVGMWQRQRWYWHQGAARIAVHLQRFSLPARAVQGCHELDIEAFAKRMINDQPLEIQCGVGVPPKIEQRVDPLLHQGQAQL
jgi:hypothetical protein